MNCKNFKIKQKNYKRIFYCKIQRKEIDYHKCNKECDFYEDKINKSNSTKLKKMTNCHVYKSLRQKSKELAQLERNRFSILGSTKNECYMCPATTNLTWHEVFRGKNRLNSMKYGLCLRLCDKCHEKYQEDKEFNNYWHKQAQIRFNQLYPDLNFLSIFKRNYL